MRTPLATSVLLQFRALLLVAVLLGVLPLGAQGCAKLKAERADATAHKAALQAIQAYSTAADAASAAHAAVLAAFEKANHAANLAEYRRGLRDDVLPAMDAFLVKLRAVPTGTPDLLGIHGKLVAAYEQARREIADFERRLEDIGNLPQFASIRDQLQAAVKVYRAELTAYYGRFHRQLQVAPAPRAATPTGAP